MDDLIFVLNTKESEKSGMIIIESYVCNNKVNKKNKYIGGTNLKVDIFEKDSFGNFSKDELLNLRCHFERLIPQISFYQYVVEVPEFLQLLKIYEMKRIFYITALKCDINLIAQFREESTYESKKKDKLCCISGFKLWYCTSNSELVVVKKNDIPKEIIKMKPVGKMVLKEHIFFMMFQYEGMEVEWGDSSFLLSYGDSLILRQYKEERELVRKAETMGFQRKKENQFYFNDEISAQEQLQKEGFLFEHYSGRKKDNRDVTVQLINTKNDWFDLRIYCEYNNETIELSSLINLFGNQKSVALKDGNRIDIPRSIVENAPLIVQENGCLRVPKNNMWCLLDIARENKINLDEFISYENIKVSFDKKIEQKIFEFQRTGTKWLKWLYLNRIGGCLADDMGVGKTFQTIAFLFDKELNEKIRKVLIIVPYVLMSNWLREFEKFSSETSIVVYHGKNRNEILESDRRIIISTYATSANDIDILGDILYDVIIFDEIQMVKNNTSKTYKQLMKLQSRCRIGLSGTPLENKLDELWNVLNLLNPGKFISKKKFVSKYKNINELHGILSPFILRRTKEQVLDELPKKQEEVVYCNFGETQNALYNAIKVKVKESSLTNNRSSVMLKGLLLLRQVCCHPLLLNDEVNVQHFTESCKFDALKLKTEQIIQNGHKVVIFSQFTAMLHLVEEWCQDKEYKYFYIDGDVVNRQKIIDEFEQSEDGIFLISLKAGGVGLNLTSAHYAILYEPWWNPFVEQQAEDRLLRIGQKKEVTIYKLIVADSIEEKIMNLQRSKQQLFLDVMEGADLQSIDLREFIDSL